MGESLGSRPPAPSPRADTRRVSSSGGLRPGQEASTHNSGVIHAGIYYPTGSLKARLCVDGRDRLYRFCRDHHVPHERCGKLIVAATTAELAGLEALAAQAHDNGVDDLEVIDRSFLRRLEPHVEGVAAIWSPSTGIVEAEALVRELTHAARRDVHLLPGTWVIGGTPSSSGIEIQYKPRAVSGAGRCQRRRSACGRCLHDARRRDVYHLSGARRVC